MQKPILSMKDTAKELGVSYIWLHRKTIEGKIPYIKLGGKKFIRRDTINLICDEGVA